MADTTWRQELESEMESHGETPADVVATTLTDAELDRVFDGGYGDIEGLPFTVWTPRRVYFPAASWDGLEWVASVSRMPDGQPTPHVVGS